MRGIRRLWPILGGVGLCFALVVSGCKKSQDSQTTTPATGTTEEAEPRSRRLSRGELSCRFHSCAPPYFCNESSGLCEMLPCVESRDCPYGYKCDHEEKVCR